jgi:hypothetical protein
MTPAGGPRVIPLTVDACVPQATKRPILGTGQTETDGPFQTKRVGRHSPPPPTAQRRLALSAPHIGAEPVDHWPLTPRRPVGSSSTLKAVAGMVK